MQNLVQSFFSITLSGYFLLFSKIFFKFIISFWRKFDFLNLLMPVSLGFISLNRKSINELTSIPVIFLIDSTLFI